MLPFTELLDTIRMSVCGCKIIFSLGCTDIAQPLRNLPGLFHRWLKIEIWSLGESYSEVFT